MDFFAGFWSAMAYLACGAAILLWIERCAPCASDRLDGWDRSIVHAMLIVALWPITYTAALMLCRSQCGEDEHGQF